MEPLGDQLEVVDEGLHRLPHDLADVVRRVALPVGGDGQARGPGDLRVGHHGGRPLAGIQALQGLPDDAHRLVALVEAHHRAVVDVGLVPGGHVELVVLVAAVGLGLAQVEGQACGAHPRARVAQGHEGAERHDGHVAQALLEDRVLLEDVLELPDVAAHAPQALPDVARGALADVLDDAAGADVLVVHAEPGDALEDPEDLLAPAEGDGHDGRGAHLVARGADGDQVRGDAAQLHHDDADHRGALGHVVGDAEQLLDAQAVGGLLEERRHVVHARAVGDALGPGAVLHVLLDAGVQVPGVDAGLADLLAVELQDEAEHAVRGGVDGPQVDDDALGGELLDLGQDLVPVPALGEDLGDVVEGQVGGAGRCVEGGSAHQFTLLRVSGGGVVAPLNSTGTPPRG